jgi:hypothetical protein
MTSTQETDVFPRNLEAAKGSKPSRTDIGCEFLMRKYFAKAYKKVEKKPPQKP